MSNFQHNKCSNDSEYLQLAVRSTDLSSTNEFSIFESPNSKCQAM